MATWAFVTHPSAAGVVPQPVSMASWVMTFWRPRRMASRPEAVAPLCPGTSDVAVEGEEAQAGDGEQRGFEKSSICPRVVLERARPAASFTRVVMITPYSVFSLSAGNMNE